MANFVKLTIKNGSEIYVSKYAITYMSKDKDGGTFISFTAPQHEETNHIIVKELIEDVLFKFNN